MAYFLNLFSPETYRAFGRSDRSISGFRERQKSMAERINKGDRFVCYMTKLSRWIGILEVIDGPFRDESPVFYSENDPFILRFRVQALAWLDIDKTIPIHEDSVWDTLSFTRGQDKRTSSWTGKIRSSLVQLDDHDGKFLERMVFEQQSGGAEYPVDEGAMDRLATLRVRRADKDVSVTVPVDADADEAVQASTSDVRESLRIQALIAGIGVRMGMQIWIPRSDRSAVLSELDNGQESMLERLPLNYDDITLKTVEQIDVLWLKGRSIRRAFEVEHTTSVYSGILRMADLLALQPNMDIRLHIVAPVERREKVFGELRRPVFSLLDRGPLSESCTFLSYDSVRQLANEKHLAYFKDAVLSEFEEEADE